MATRYWVFGGITVNWASTSNWSATSGGATGASVPVAGDDVIFDHNSFLSGIPAMTFNLACRNFTFLMDNVGNASPDAATLAMGSFKITASGDVLIGNGVTVTSTTGGGGGLVFNSAANCSFECLATNSYFDKVTINSPGFTVSFVPGDMFGVSYIYNGHYTFGTFTVTAGGVGLPTQDQYTPIVTVKIFDSANTNTRTIDFGGHGGMVPGFTYLYATSSFVVNTTNLTMLGTINTTITMSNNTSFYLESGTFLGGVVTLGTCTLDGGAALGFVTLGGVGAVTIGGFSSITSFTGLSGCRVDFNAGSNIGGFTTIKGVAFALQPGYSHTWNLTGWDAAYLNNVAITCRVAGLTATLRVTGVATVSFLYAKDLQVTGGLTAYRSVDGGNNGGIRFVTGFKKYYTAEVYGKSGDYRGQYNDIWGDPQFQQEVNSPGGSMTINRAVDPFNYGEGTLVDYNNKVIVRCFNEDAPNGEVIFQGFIADYTPITDERDQYVEIILMGYGDELSQYDVIASMSKDVDITGAVAGTLGPYDKVAVSWTPSVGVTNLKALLWQFSWAGFLCEVSIYKDNGSNTPDNTTPLFTTTYNFAGSPGAVYDTYMPIDPALTVTPGSKYWVVAQAFGPGAAVYMPYQTPSVYAGGNCAHYTGGAWVQDTTFDSPHFSTYASTGNTTVTYNTSIEQALQDIIDNYRIQGGVLNYTADSIDPITANINYTFQTTKVLDAIKKLCDLSPAGTYWYVDQATNTIYFKSVAATPRHYFTMGRDVRKVRPQKTMETVVNTVVIQGGDTGGGTNLLRIYTNVASKARHGQRLMNYVDSSLTSTANADKVATKIITQFKDPTWRNNAIEVLSFPDGGYHIEEIKPGDTFIVMGYVGFIMLQITRIGYGPDVMSIDASTVLPQVASDIADISQTVEQISAISNPAAPTYIAV